MSKEAVSELIWPTNPQSFHQIKALFQEPDADVILEISEDSPYSDDPTSITYAFKAHKHKLAAASKTFEHMFSVPDQPESGPDGTEGEIATIVLDVSWKTIYALLASAYNRMEITALLARMSAQTRLDVYEAAHKYQFDQLAAWVSCCIQSVPKIICIMPLYDTAHSRSITDLTGSQRPTWRLPMLCKSTSRLRRTTTKTWQTWW